METHSEDGIWQRINDKLKTFREELKKDSVAYNLSKPVDCCNPPVPPRVEHKLKK